MSAHTAAQLLLSAAKYRFGRKFKEAKTTKNLKELNLTLLKELTQYYNHTSICGNTGIPPSFTEYGYILQHIAWLSIGLFSFVQQRHADGDFPALLTGKTSFALVLILMSLMAT